jgi:type I restriction enzyme, S subunit
MIQISKPYFEMKGNSTTLAYVNRQGFSDLPLMLPPVSEQGTIVAAVETSESHFDQLILNTKGKITLLREYRTRLIGDVVTGKLDVRDAAASLPDEALESEALDEVDDLLQDESAANDLEAEAVDAA